MFSNNTRSAVVSQIALALVSPQEKGEDVLTVKTARKIFHTEWSDDDIETMCNFIRKGGKSNSNWPNGTDWIFKQVFQFFHKATDHQIITWLKEIWGSDRALAYIMSCEQGVKKGGVANDKI